MHTKQLDSALHESRINVVLGARITALKVSLRNQTARAERRVHEHDIELPTHGLNESYALFGVVRKKPTTRTTTVHRIGDIGLKRIEDLFLRPFEKCEIVDA